MNNSLQNYVKSSNAPTAEGRYQEVVCHNAALLTAHFHNDPAGLARFLDREDQYVEQMKKLIYLHVRLLAGLDGGWYGEEICGFINVDEGVYEEVKDVLKLIHADDLKVRAGADGMLA